jgi:hypothetical protein
LSRDTTMHLHKDLITHRENQCGTSDGHDMSIASGNGRNISIFFVNVWKYLVSLSIILVVPLSTR